MTEDQVRRLLEAMKHDIERLFHRDIKQVTDTLARIEREVLTTNGRVTRLEQKAIASDAVAADRAGQAKDAAELVANKAAQAISDRERSRRWWLGVVGAVTGGVVAITTLTGLLSQALSH